MKGKGHVIENKNPRGEDEIATTCKTRAWSERATETDTCLSRAHTPLHTHTHSYTFTHQQRRSGLISGLELCVYDDMPKV